MSAAKEGEAAVRSVAAAKVVVMRLVRGGLEVEISCVWDCFGAILAVVEEEIIDDGEKIVAIGFGC